MIGGGGVQVQIRVHLPGGASFQPKVRAQPIQQHQRRYEQQDAGSTAARQAGLNREATSGVGRALNLCALRAKRSTLQRPKRPGSAQ